MGTATTRGPHVAAGWDWIPGQITVAERPDGRIFAVVKGRRWTRVHEYLSNGQLTARWFADEASGEVREAEGARKPRSWRMGGDAAAFVREIIAQARGEAEEPAATRRDWLKVGKPYIADKGLTIERQIAALRWTNEPEVAMAPGLGIRACIRELEIPKVTAYATNGYLELPDGEEGMGAYAIYGIEGNYKNARIRLYVLDKGSELVPLCVDVWEREVVACSA